MRLRTTALLIAGFAGVVAARAQGPGDGNPFVRIGPPRSSLLAPRVDPAVTPAAYDAVLPTSAAPLPASVVPPATTVLPNVFDPPPTAIPLAGAPAAQPVAAGTAILKQRGPDGEHPLAPVARWCDDALRQAAGLRDYTCTFKKREYVDGRLQDQQVLFVKSRPAPLSVYLYFLTPSDARGQEAIYVEGRNNGRLVAHPTGIKKALVGTLSLAPNDPQAMDGNRYPITDFGLRRLCERYYEGCRDEMQFGECDVRIIDNVQVEGRPCTCIQVAHPVQRREFRFHVTRLYVDDQWNLPCRYEAYAWPQQPGQSPPLVEEYTYSQLKLNVGLTDADFDPANPNYGFE